MTTSGSGRGGDDDRPKYGERVTPTYGGPIEPRGADLPAPRPPSPLPPVPIASARVTRRPRWRGPSPLFLGILVVAIAAGWVLLTGALPAGPVAFVFVVSVWIITLCLHEFAHALVAYRYGDLSVAHRGYLTLDPLRYTHVMFSIVLPLLFLIAGGIGLPGGAVFIDRRALRSRFANAAVSAAGPLTNALVAVILAIAIRIGGGPTNFWDTISFLLFLQVTATVLNLLPIPGLDGFGIIEPYLPVSVRSGAARIAPFAVLGLFALLWIPQVNSAFFMVIFSIIGFFGVPLDAIGYGYGLFQFWR